MPGPHRLPRCQIGGDRWKGYASQTLTAGQHDSASLDSEMTRDRYLRAPRAGVRLARPIADAESQNLRGHRGATFTDPRAFGLVKAAYGVRETLELLSVGRTSLYAAVKRGELTPIKFGKKTLFCATDLAAFLTRMKEMASRQANASRRRSTQ
jgi:excisionase family DNA binding protein